MISNGRNIDVISGAYWVKSKLIGSDSTARPIKIDVEPNNSSIIRKCNIGLKYGVDNYSLYNIVVELTGKSLPQCPVFSVPETFYILGIKRTGILEIKIDSFGDVSEDEILNYIIIEQADDANNPDDITFTEPVYSNNKITMTFTHKGNFTNSYLTFYIASDLCDGIVEKYFSVKIKSGRYIIDATNYLPSYEYEVQIYSYNNWNTIYAWDRVTSKDTFLIYPITGTEDAVKTVKIRGKYNDGGDYFNIGIDSITVNPCQPDDININVTYNGPYNG